MTELCTTASMELVFVDGASDFGAGKGARGGLTTTLAGSSRVGIEDSIVGARAGPTFDDAGLAFVLALIAEKKRSSFSSSLQNAPSSSFIWSVRR